MDSENVIKELTNLPTTIYDGFYQLRITHDLRDKVIALLKEQEAMHWVSVKDRLPDKKWTDYLVATRLCDGTFGINIAWLNSDDGEWKSNDEWICDGREVITHWMPLPEPPEEEKRKRR